MRPPKKNLQFHITHIDPLGQGVDKNDGEITFIAKTLPEETGTAEIYKSKKGVRFAKLTGLKQRSEKRIMPECPHFEDCPGCDYLHTDYETELQFKKAALKKTFQLLHFDWEKLEVFPAPRRTGYRNRIQLHYREKRLGLIDGLRDCLVEIPQCPIVCEPLRPALTTLYSDPHWRKEGHEGHCELYFHQGEVQVTWNAPYAHGGFSQVFDEMNVRLRDTVADILKGKGASSVLDLFSGDGNLSDQIIQNHGVTRVRVDGYSGASLRGEMLGGNTPGQPASDFVQLDLFSPEALKRFEKKCAARRFDVMLVDPPRKGFPNLNAWLERFRPETLIYVSCHPATLARDLGRIQRPHTLFRLMLIDLFPGTRHFESVAAIHFSSAD